MVNKSRGRPRQPTDARERILAAARARFSSQGYSATTLRGIAKDADVDHALVSYYFGSKEGVFRSVAELIVSPARVLDRVAAHASPDQLPVVLLRTALQAWDRADYQTGLNSLLVETALHPATQLAIREYLETELVRRLGDIIGGVDASQRAAAAGSLIAGLYFTRYLLRLEPMASMESDDIVRQLAPALHTILSSRARSNPVSADGARRGHGM